MWLHAGFKAGSVRRLLRCNCQAAAFDAEVLEDGRQRLGASVERQLCADLVVGLHQHAPSLAPFQPSQFCVHFDLVGRWVSRLKSYDLRTRFVPTLAFGPRELERFAWGEGKGLGCAASELLEDQGVPARRPGPGDTV